MDGASVMNISEEDKTFLEKFTECHHLSLNGCGLKSLENFPSLPKLTKVRIDLLMFYQLELNDNRLSEGISALTMYAELYNLKLANNLLKTMAIVKEIVPLEKL